MEKGKVRFWGYLKFDGLLVMIRNYDVGWLVKGQKMHKIWNFAKDNYENEYIWSY